MDPAPAEHPTLDGGAGRLVALLVAALEDGAPTVGRSVARPPVDVLSVVAGALRSGLVCPPQLRIAADGALVSPDRFCVGSGDDAVPDATEVEALLASGAVLVINRFDEHLRPLGTTVDEIAGAIGRPVTANLYFGPSPSSAGFPAHWDDHDTMLIQLEGTKNWEVGPQSDLRSIGLGYGLQREAPVLDPPILLEAGDALVLPRGHWHRGVAGDEGSLHVTLTVHRPLVGGVLLNALDRLEGEVASAAVQGSGDTGSHRAQWTTPSLHAVVDEELGREAARSRRRPPMSVEQLGLPACGAPDHRCAALLLGEVIPSDAVRALADPASLRSPRTWPGAAPDATTLASFELVARLLSAQRVRPAHLRLISDGADLDPAAYTTARPGTHDSHGAHVDVDAVADAMRRGSAAMLDRIDLLHPGFAELCADLEWHTDADVVCSIAAIPRCDGSIVPVPITTASVAVLQAVGSTRWSVGGGRAPSVIELEAGDLLLLPSESEVRLAALGPAVHVAFEVRGTTAMDLHRRALARAIDERLSLRESLPLDPSTWRAAMCDHLRALDELERPSTDDLAAAVARTLEVRPVFSLAPRDLRSVHGALVTRLRRRPEIVESPSGAILVTGGARQWTMEGAAAGLARRLARRRRIDVRDLDPAEVEAAPRLIETGFAGVLHEPTSWGGWA